MSEVSQLSSRFRTNTQRTEFFCYYLFQLWHASDFLKLFSSHNFVPISPSVGWRLRKIGDDFVHPWTISGMNRVLISVWQIHMYPWTWSFDSWYAVSHDDKWNGLVPNKVDLVVPSFRTFVKVQSRILKIGCPMARWWHDK